MAKKSKDPTVLVAFRLPKSLIEKIDAEGALLGSQLGFRVNRTELVQKALKEWLASRDHARKQEPSK